MSAQAPQLWTVSRMIYRAWRGTPERIAERARTQPLPGTGAAACALCGMRDTVMFPARDVLSGEFTDIPYATGAVCAPCAHCVRVDALPLLGRRGGRLPDGAENPFCRPGRLTTPDRIEWLTIEGIERALLDPPAPPFALQIALTINAWRHHLFHRTPVAYSRAPFPALVALTSTDIATAVFDPRQARRDLADIRRILAAPVGAGRPRPRLAAHILAQMAPRASLGDLPRREAAQITAWARATGLSRRRIAALARRALDPAGRVLLEIARRT